MLASASLAYVDAVEGPEGLYLAWNGSVALHNGGCQRDFSLPLASIGQFESDTQAGLLVAVSDLEQGVTDSLYLLGYTDLETLSLRDVDPEEITGLEPPDGVNMDMRLSRYSLGGGGSCLAAYAAIYFSSMTDLQFLTSTVVWEDDQLVLQDTLRWAPSPGKMMVDHYLPPVQTASGNPLAVWAESGGYWEFYMNHTACLHSFPSPRGALPNQPFYHYDTSEVFSKGTILALGSCAEEAVALWTTEWSLETRYSTFDCMSPETTSTAAFPWQWPDGTQCAMSSSPADSGLLLAWFQGGQIRCRHWNGEWNQYDHVVRDGTTISWGQNIAVCSSDDGYWVVWLPSGADYPEVEFVQRGDVTGIEGFEDHGFQSGLRVWPNPASSAITVAAPCGCGTVSLYDLSGRLVRTAGVGEAGIASMETGGLASGVYVVRSTGSGPQALKITIVIVN